MPPLRTALFAVLLLAAAPVVAAPRVVADIAPVQSIAAAVMAGVAAPILIVPAGASEHDHSLRPSEAQALEAANLVVWIGPSLTPWLAGPLDALAADAPRLTLADAPGLRLLPIREGGPFEAHGHDPDHDPAEGQDADPHVWLDPQNAAAMAGAIADALGAVDPANAPIYARNATAFAADMERLSAEIAARLQPLKGEPYYVFHDAFQYFEARFDLPAAGSVAISSGEAPRAPRVAQIRARIEAGDVECVFSEPQFEPKLIATLIEGTKVGAGTLDALGVGLEPGPGLYPAMLRGLADGLSACLAPRS